MLHRVLEGATQMKDSAAALQQKVAAGRQEIERLRQILNRARDEALVDPRTRISTAGGSTRSSSRC